MRAAWADDACSGLLVFGSPPPALVPMTFLDPYSKNRRIPLLGVGRVALRVIVVALYCAVTWFWEWLWA